MKRVSVVGIFAHPDDESFGPAGTIAKLAETNDVYIICATSGEAGENPTGKDLGEIRRHELQKSSKILGVKSVFFLGYEDGTLSNNLYHKLAADIRKILDDIRPEVVITLEPRGISGHIDHVTISMVCSYLFEQLSYIKKILYHCITQERRSRIGEYFIYFPPGYSESEINETYDVDEVWEKKVMAMNAHESQAADANAILSQIKGLAKKECFLMRKK